MKQIQQTYHRLEKRIHLVLALQLLLAIGITAFNPGGATAVQLTAKSIQMSDSGPSGAGITSGVGSGTSVAYKVTFSTTSTTTAVGGIAIDFCTSPIVGSACTAPTVGFNTNRATTQIYNQTGMGTGSYSVYTSDATANRIIITRGTPANPTATSSFELGNGTTNGITNPTSTGSFFARIYTYATASAAQNHVTGAGSTGFIDSGSVAMATATVITITALVQETMTFCVFGGAAPSDNCVANGSTVPPALEIGHFGAGTKRYIDSTAVDTANAYMQMSTNAGSGATVRMHSSSATGGLDSGTNSIPPVNSGSGSTGTITAGSAAFGLFVAASSGGTGTVTPDGNYNTSGSGYGMDSTSATNVTTTYGDTIASSGTPVSNVNNTLTFAATASNVTPAGLYKANLSLVATGVF